MNALNSLFEIAATFTECLVAFLSVTEIACVSDGMKKRRRILLIIGCAALLTVIISLLNVLETFSFLTVLVTILIVVCLTSFVFKAPILLIALGTVITYFVVHCVDYITLFALGAVFETPIQNNYTFALLLTPGWFRILFLTVDKALDFLLYLLLKGKMKRLQRLSYRVHLFLLLLYIAVYATMSVMLSLVISDSIIAMQTAVIGIWIFMLLCMFSVLAFLLISSDHREEREAYHLLQTANSMIKENYTRLHQMQMDSSKRNHDINNHLKVLRSLVQDGETERASAYIDTLLAVSLEKSSICHSGNDVIDAIINCKMAEAQELEIPFEFQTNFSIPTNIEPVDICAVLANQIDNALDACRAIEDKSKRSIRVHVWEKEGNMAIFQVNNSVTKNPFEGNEKLLSTKADHSRPHGLGIRSIRETAAKYQGMLENTYHNGEFISIAVLSFQFPDSYEKGGEN